MKKYVTTNDMNKLQGIKGQILEEKNGVVLVKTSNIYTVWIPESGLMITNTFYISEAALAFDKYSESREL
jgi:hypothetical protein